MLLVFVAAPAWAQGEPDTGGTPDEEVDEVVQESAEAAVNRARSAFGQADYGTLVSILESVVPDRVDDLSVEDRIDARQLYAVGLFFRAQQATGPAERDALLDQARSSFLDLLREDPYFQLDPLLYPASVVELFDDVVANNAEELEKLREELRPNDGPQTIETVYIQREQERATFALIFFPFAVGQFQNGDLIKGTLLASIQAAALTLNFTSFLMIESLRNPRGYYCSGVEGSETPLCAGESNDFATALAWRNVLYGSLITFGLAYVISVVDAWAFFEEYNVNIRTLDGPPPELTDVPGSDRSAVPLGFSLDFDW